ncbi:hypothetical protein MyNCGM70_35640 [Achromobacter xylosoxidans]
MRAARRGALRLLVAIQVRARGDALALAQEGGAEQFALQHRAAGAHQQPARIAAHGIAGLESLARGEQRVVEIPRLAPARAARLVPQVQAGIGQVARRARHLIQAAVRASQPALADHAVLHVQGAAGQIDGRTGARHHVAATELDIAALRHPFADRVRPRAEIAAHFQ